MLLNNLKDITDMTNEYLFQSQKKRYKAFTGVVQLGTKAKMYYSYLPLNAKLLL